MRDLNGDPKLPEQTRYYAMVNDGGGFMRGCGLFEKGEFTQGPTSPSPVGTGTPTPGPTVFKVSALTG